LAPADEQLALAPSEEPEISPPEPSPEVTNPESTRLKPLVSVPVPENKPADPPDIDKDGIVDASDSCPETISGVPVLANGCAMFGDAVPGLTFFPDTDRLTVTGVTVLDTVANTLTDESDIRVTVAAHTGVSADPNAAMFLTRRRTIAIIRYLSDKGIDATRLRPEAYGDTQPLVNAVQPSDNDRVVLTLR